MNACMLIDLFLPFRYHFRTGPDTVSQQLYTALTSLQMGLAEDTKGWTVAVD
jgi:branched-chain amino acid aminotransferase